MGKKTKKSESPAAPVAAKTAPTPVSTKGAPAPVATPATNAPPAPKKSFMASLLPEGGMLPWWVILLLSVYLLLKLGMTLEHPCGILGTHAPVSRGQVSKAFRTLSMCTHPDKLMGYSASDVRRGELLFKRASAARDQLLAALRDEEGEGQALASCDTQLDAAIYQGVMLLGGWLFETGASSIFYSIFNFFWELCTFQYDISTTVSCALLSMTVFRTLQGLLSFIFATGPITALFSIVTYSVIGPLPSLYRLVVLPPVRLHVFFTLELLPFIRGEAPRKALPPSPNEGSESPNKEGVRGRPLQWSEDGSQLELQPEPAAGSKGGAAAGGAPGGAPGDNTDREGHESEDEDTAPMPLLATQAAAATPSAPSDGGANGSTPAPPFPTKGQAKADDTTAESAADAATAAARTKLPSRDEDAPRRGLRHRKGGEGKASKEAEALAAPPHVQLTQEDLFGPPVGSLPLRRIIERKPLPDMRIAAAAHIQFELLLSTTK